MSVIHLDDWGNKHVFGNVCVNEREREREREYPEKTPNQYWKCVCEWERKSERESTQKKPQTSPSYIIRIYIYIS